VGQLTRPGELVTNSQNGLRYTFQPDGTMKFAYLALAIAPLSSGLGAAPQNAPDLMASYVNRSLILVRVADHGEKLKLKRDQLPRLRGTCDIAVRVAGASWSKGTAHFHLEMIGYPTITGQPRGRCSGGSMPVEIAISGYAPDEDGASAAASVAAILPSPEQYLANHGIAFQFPPEDNSSSPQADPFRSGPGRTPPKVLFKVDASYSEEARHAKIQGSVTFRLIVGTDGRVHNLQLVRGLGHGLDENVLKAANMWLFQPGSIGDKPTRLAATAEMSFRLL